MDTLDVRPNFNPDGLGSCSECSWNVVGCNEELVWTMNHVVEAGPGRKTLIAPACSNRSLERVQNQTTWCCLSFVPGSVVLNQGRPICFSSAVR